MWLLANVGTEPRKIEENKRNRETLASGLTC